MPFNPAIARTDAIMHDVHKAYNAVVAKPKSEQLTQKIRDELNQLGVDGVAQYESCFRQNARILTDVFLWMIKDDKEEVVIFLHRHYQQHFDIPMGLLLHALVRKSCLSKANIVWLLRHGLCDINARDAEGETSLYLSARTNHTAFTILFVHADLAILPQETEVNLQEEEPCLIHYFVVAIKSAQTETVKFLLQKQKTLVNMRLGGKYPIQHAVAVQSVVMVRFLIDNGADISPFNEDYLTSITRREPSSTALRQIATLIRNARSTPSLFFFKERETHDNGVQVSNNTLPGRVSNKKELFCQQVERRFDEIYHLAWSFTSKAADYAPNGVQNFLENVDIVARYGTHAAPAQYGVAFSAVSHAIKTLVKKIKRYCSLKRAERLVHRLKHLTPRERAAFIYDGAMILAMRFEKQINCLEASGEGLERFANNVVTAVVYHVTDADSNQYRRSPGIIDQLKRLFFRVAKNQYIPQGITELKDITELFIEGVIKGSVERRSEEQALGYNHDADEILRLDGQGSTERWRWITIGILNNTALKTPSGKIFIRDNDHTDIRRYGYYLGTEDEAELRRLREVTSDDERYMFWADEEKPTEYVINIPIRG